MNEKTISPLGDRVLVEVIEVKLQSTSTIIIPESVTSGTMKLGKVLAVGPGLYTANGTLIPMTVNIGNEVLLPIYEAGRPVMMNGKKYVIFRESELEAKLS